MVLEITIVLLVPVENNVKFIKSSGKKIPEGNIVRRVFLFRMISDDTFFDGRFKRLSHDRFAASILTGFPQYLIESLSRPEGLRPRQAHLLEIIILISLYPLAASSAELDSL